MTKNHFGEKIAVLCKSSGITQTALAEKLEITHSQLNPFLNGHKDIYASTFINLLKEIGIDLEFIITEKIKTAVKIGDVDLKTSSEKATYLFNQLDELGQQSILSQLMWTLNANETEVEESIVGKVKQDIYFI